MNNPDTQGYKYVFSDMSRTFECYLPVDKAKELQREIEKSSGGIGLNIPKSANFAKSPREAWQNGETFNRRYLKVYDLFKRFLPDVQAEALHLEIVKNAAGLKVYVPITEENKHRFADFCKPFESYLPGDKARELQLEIARLFGSFVIIVPQPGEKPRGQYLKVYELFKCFLPSRKVKELHQEIVRCLGGHKVHVPMFKRLSIPERNECIRNDFTGNNCKELAKKYNMTYAAITVIVRNNS